MTPKIRNLENDLHALAREYVPQRSVAADVMRRLHNQAQPGIPAKSLFRRRLLMRTSVGIAAAALVTASLLFFLTPQQPAFAQVLQKIEKTQTMSCDLENSSEGTVHLFILFIRGDFMRVETHEGNITIGNRITGQWVALNPKEHTAMKINMMRYPLDLYALFRDFKDGKEERLGDKQIDGKKVTGYRVTRPLGVSTDRDMPLTLWVDSTTNLPVEAEVNADGHTSRITHFQWGPAS